MKNSKTDIVGIVIALVFLGGVGYLVYRLGALVINNLEKVNINILVPVLAGAFTITGYFITRYLERKKIIEQQIWEQKIPLYQDFLQFIFKVFQGVKKGAEHEVTEKEMGEFFWTLNQKSILWLSDRTLKSYIRWKNDLISINSEDIESKEKGVRILLSFEELLLDFRRDIGHENKDIKQGEILSLFVNDWIELNKKDI